MSNERELIEAAEAVVARWYTPKWKDEEHTAVFINRLRDALAAPAQELSALPELPRYDLVENSYGHGYMTHWDKALELDPDGEWCRFSDVAAYGLLCRQQGGSDAARDVLAERQRQMSVEGWTPEHDDQHSKGVLARAAAVYAIEGSSVGRTVIDDGSTPSVTERLWPWAWSWFKPNGQRRNLVKAGALILAEIERLDRAAIQAQAGEGADRG